MELAFLLLGFPPLKESREMGKLIEENQYGESITDNGDGSFTFRLNLSPETSAKLDAVSELVAVELGRPVSLPEVIAYIAKSYIADNSVDDEVLSGK